MTKILAFAEQNYVILIIISLILIFALIGYFVNIKNKKETPFKIASDKMKESNDLNIENIEVSNNISLQQKLKDNASHNGDEIL